MTNYAHPKNTLDYDIWEKGILFGHLILKDRFQRQNKL